MSGVFIQAVKVQGVLQTTVTTAGITTTTGNAILFGVGHFTGAGNFSSISDSNGNTYTTDVGPTTGGTNDARIASNTNITGGAGHTFTGTCATNGYLLLLVSEFSGLATSSAFDKSATGTETGTSHSTAATATLSQADEVVYAIGAANTLGALPVIANSDGTFTEVLNEPSNLGENGVAAYKTVNATTAVSWNGWTSNNSITAVSVLATYKAAAAGGGTQGKPLINSGLINHGLISQSGLVG